MSDIPALIARFRAHAAVDERCGRYQIANVQTEAADALEAEHARAEDKSQKLNELGVAYNVLSMNAFEAQARIAALEAALEPFRKAANALHPLGPNIQPVDVSIWSFSGGVNVENVSITFADLFEARAVLEKVDE